MPISNYVRETDRGTEMAGVRHHVAMQSSLVPSVCVCVPPLFSCAIMR